MPLNALNLQEICDALQAVLDADPSRATDPVLTETEDGSLINVDSVDAQAIAGRVIIRVGV